MTDTEVALRQRRAIDALRDQIAPDATDEELLYLAQVGQRQGLDPIAGHIVLISRWDSRLKRNVARPQITAEGRLVLAERTGLLDGFIGPEWCGPRNPDGSHTWVEVWDDDTPPHAARTLVYRKDRAHPANGTVRWAEFRQTDRAGNLLPTWAAMPSHMLGKTALSLGLRRAFPGVVPVGDVDDDLTPWENGTEPAADPAADPAPDLAVESDRAEVVRRLYRLDEPQREHVRAAAKARRLQPVGGARAEHLLVYHRLIGDALDAAELAPHTDEPTPSDVIDRQPETVDEPAYSYDDPGRPFATADDPDPGGRFVD